MVQEKYTVRLSPEDQAQLERLIRRGQCSARVINRSRILLKTDDGWSASQVAVALDTSPRTVFRTKRRYAEEGLGGVLQDHPQANRYRKLDDRGEAHLIALACSDAPEGHDHWDPAVAGWQGGGTGRGGVAIPRDGKAQAQKTTLKPWRKQQWCIPERAFRLSTSSSTSASLDQPLGGVGILYLMIKVAVFFVSPGNTLTCTMPIPSGFAWSGPSWCPGDRYPSLGRRRPPFRGSI